MDERGTGAPPGITAPGEARGSAPRQEDRRAPRGGNPPRGPRPRVRRPGRPRACCARRPIVTSRVLVEPYQLASHTSAISRSRETTLPRWATRMSRTSNSLPVSDTSVSPKKTRRASWSMHDLGAAGASAARRRLAGAPQQRADPGLQLGEAERLGQVVVGAVVEADHPVELAGTRRDDHDRPGEAVLAGPLAHLETVHVGQPEVEDHHVGEGRAHLLERGTTATRATRRRSPRAPACGREGRQCPPRPPRSAPRHGVEHRGCGPGGPAFAEDGVVSSSSSGGIGGRPDGAGGARGLPARHDEPRRGWPGPRAAASSHPGQPRGEELGSRRTGRRAR